MRVLDLDLDFFMNGVAHWKDDTERLPISQYKAWSEAEVIGFLENKCGLKKDGNIPGRVIKHHHEAFYLWRELISDNKLDVPFEVVHIDGHSDLGMGDSSYLYLMTRLLALPVAERPSAIESSNELGPGNYLAFALACRWLKELTYVPNPASGNSLINFYFKDYEPLSGFVELKYCEIPGGRQSYNLNADLTDEAFGVLKKEPQVPFRQVSEQDFVDGEPYDLIILSKSPGFTTVESDKLIPIIEKYFCTI